MKQTLKYILQYIIENLKIAETKHSIIIALDGAVAALALSLSKPEISFSKYLNYAVLFFAGLMGARFAIYDKIKEKKNERN